MVVYGLFITLLLFKASLLLTLLLAISSRLGNVRLQNIPKTQFQIHRILNTPSFTALIELGTSTLFLPKINRTN